MARKDAEAIVSGAGWIGSLADQLVEALLERGCTHEDIRTLVTRKPRPQLAINTVADAVSGLIRQQKGIPVRSTFARDMRTEGWTLEADIAVREGEVISGSPELISFLKEGESYVIGDTLVIRAADLGCPWGQRHAETLLENQHLIPEEARKYYLVFTERSGGARAAAGASRISTGSAAGGASVSLGSTITSSRVVVSSVPVSS